MQEELEDEIKLSVGEQPSPVAVLVPAQVPFQFVACQGHSTSESPEYCKDLGNQTDFYGWSWWMWGVWRGVRSLGGLCTVLGVLAQGACPCPWAATCKHGMGRVLGEQAG